MTPIASTLPSRSLGKTVLAAAMLCAASLAHATNPQAANTAALSDPACTKLGDIYWEIGDAKERLVYGEIGRKYTEDKPIAIASASKWVWGAYVLQDPAQPTAAGSASLRMLSGYTHFKPLSCFIGRHTVQSCLAKRGNGELSKPDIGRFSYNGGHAQQLAVELKLGALDSEGLATEVRTRLGPSLAFDYAAPSPAGGMRATPTAYAAFLRSILKGDLRMKQFLGKDSVCTTRTLCPEVGVSPGLPGWRYSYHHWVEADGTTSSAGAEGFYPWITADHQYYGLVARQARERKAGMNSAACGAAIRKAFLR